MAIAERYQDVTIESGNTESDVVAVPLRHSMVGIIAPDTLTGTVTVEVAERLGGTFKPLQSGGANVEVAAGVAIVLTDMPFTAYRFSSNMSEGADRTFRVISKPR